MFIWKFLYYIHHQRKAFNRKITKITRLRAKSANIKPISYKNV